MRTTLFLSAVLALVLGAVTPAPMVAQDTSSGDLKTVLTVSLAGYDAAMKSIDALAKAVGAPEMTMLPKMLLGGPAGPPGWDGSKPLGIIVQTDGLTFPAIVFAPITDAEQFMEFLQGYVEDIPEPDADGVYEIEAVGQTVFVQQKDGWAFAVVERSALDNTPADPAALLGGMEKEYAIAIRVQAANLPPQLRDAALMTMQTAASAGGQRNEGETDEQFALRQKMTQNTLEGIQTLVKEMDSFTIGLSVDPADGAINLDSTITAVEGTSLADDMAETAGLKSAFTGFFSPHAALTIRATAKMSDADVAQALQILRVAGLQAKVAIEEEDLGSTETEQALEIGAELFTLVEDTINGRMIDGGFSLVAGDNGIALILGGRVSDGNKLDEIFKKVIERAKEEEPDLDQFLKLDAEQYQGVKFHTLAMPAALIFGDNVPPSYADADIKIALGFGKAAFYAAHGKDPVKLLKSAIDRSAAAADGPVEPAQFSVSARAIGSLLEIISASEEVDIPPQLITVLKEAGDQDHVLLTVQSIPNGMRSRLRIEAGVLKVIQAAVMTAVAAAAAPDPAPAPEAPAF